MAEPAEVLIPALVAIIPTKPVSINVMFKELMVMR